MHLPKLPGLVAFAALAASTLLASDVQSAVGVRYSTTPTNVQVALGTAPAESWKSVSAVGFEMDAAGRRRYAPVGFARPVPGGRYVNSFDTDLSPDVAKIAFEPIVIDTVELAPDAKGFAASRPTRLKLTPVTFTTARPSTAIRDWARTVAATGGPPRDVTVNFKGPLGAVLRTVILRRSLPRSYTADPSSAQVVLQPETLEVRGTASANWMEWFRGSLTGTFPRRDVKLVSANAAFGTVTLKNAYLTEIRLGTLDAASENFLEEGFTVQADLIEPLP